MTFTWRQRLALQMCVAFLFCIGVFASQPVTVERTFTVSGPVTLNVQSDPGGIYITRGSSSSVVVHAIIKPLYGRLDFDIAEANIRALEKNPPLEQSGNQIRIGFVKDAALLRAVSIRFEIETPRETQVRAHTESGGISIDGITGPADTVTSSGRTEIRNVEAELKVASHSGEVVIYDARGNVTVDNESGGLRLSRIVGSVVTETTSGRTEIANVTGDVRSTTHSASIRIENVTGSVVARNRSGSVDTLALHGSVHAETTSGAIRISQAEPAAIRAVTGTGAIKVELASGAGYLLDAQSNSGRVSGRATKAFSLTSNAHSLKGQVGAGGPLVDLDTDSSKIQID
jgi:hypothetical protein